MGAKSNRRCLRMVRIIALAIGSCAVLGVTAGKISLWTSTLTTTIAVIVGTYSLLRERGAKALALGWLIMASIVWVLFYLLLRGQR